MKKIIFATQVFGSIAFFPLVVVLEMNHLNPRADKHLPPGIMIQAENPVDASVKVSRLEKARESFIRPMPNHY